jgi:hypothetical protein
MQRLEVSGAVRPIYVSLGVKRLRQTLDRQNSTLSIMNNNNNNNNNNGRTPYSCCTKVMSLTDLRTQTNSNSACQIKNMLSSINIQCDILRVQKPVTVSSRWNHTINLHSREALQVRNEM